MLHIFQEQAVGFLPDMQLWIDVSDFYEKRYIHLHRWAVLLKGTLITFTRVFLEDVSTKVTCIYFQSY